MQVSFEQEQVEVLRDVLRHALSDLRIESSRTDNGDFRRMLHRREDVVASVLAKLAADVRAL